MKLILLSALALLVGCSSTSSAYKTAAAKPEEDQRLVDTSYVVVEHYAALVHEAADLKDNPATPPEVGEALKKAANTSAPFILGNDKVNPPVPSLKDLVDKYVAVKSAENKAALDKALADAVLAIRGFSDEIKRAHAAVKPSGYLGPSSQTDLLLAGA